MKKKANKPKYLKSMDDEHQVEYPILGNCLKSIKGEDPIIRNGHI